MIEPRRRGITTKPERSRSEREQHAGHRRQEAGDQEDRSRARDDGRRLGQQPPVVLQQQAGLDGADGSEGESQQEKPDRLGARKENCNRPAASSQPSSRPPTRASPEVVPWSSHHRVTASFTTG